MRAIDSDAAKRLLIDRGARDTGRSTIFDLVGGSRWPSGDTGRAITNDTITRWTGRERELLGVLDQERTRYEQAVAADDLTRRAVWAGTGLDDIHELGRAGDIVRHIAGAVAIDR
ncbi:hypothetical protein ACFY4C_22640 [Actinomadura viridis]|uniref:hypothetical protein n=1 Tax=Actinomadura viridis TaxID=58110 RepID=UPI0036871103